MLLIPKYLYDIYEICDKVANSCEYVSILHILMDIVEMQEGSVGAWEIYVTVWKLKKNFSSWENSAPDLLLVYGVWRPTPCSGCFFHGLGRRRVLPPI